MAKVCSCVELLHGLLFQGTGRGLGCFVRNPLRHSYQYLYEYDV